MKHLILFIGLMFGLATAGLSQNTITDYQYWFDADGANAVTVSITPSVTASINSNIETASLTAGLHVLNFRVKDLNGKWSATESQFFVKTSTRASNITITQVQYWLNTDIGNATTIDVTPSSSVNFNQSLDFSALKTGLHVITLRCKNSIDEWSVPVSHFFVKRPATTSGNVITQMQYWLGTDINGATTVDLTDASTVQIIDAISAGLNTGLNIVSFRFKDNVNQWSVPVSQFVTKLPTDLTGNQIVAYQYWLNDDVMNAIDVPISAVSEAIMLDDLDFTTLALGNHVLHLRAKDAHDQWSAAVSQEFLKVEVTTGVEWLSLETGKIYPNPFVDKVTIELEAGDQAVVSVYDSNGGLLKTYEQTDTIFSLDLGHLPNGQYFIVIQNDGKYKAHKIIKH